VHNCSSRVNWGYQSLSGQNCYDNIAFAGQCILGRWRHTSDLDLWPWGHITSAMLELHWLLIAARINYRLCLIVNKSFVGKWTDATIRQQSPYASHRHPNPIKPTSINRGDLNVTRTKCTIDVRVFCHNTSHLERITNDSDLKRLSTTATFKWKLKLFFFNAMMDWTCQVNYVMRHQFKLYKL